MSKLFATLSLLMVSPWLYAGSVRISPVQVDFVDQDKSASIMLSNESTNPNNLQIRVFKWVQDTSGVDQLQPTNDIAVSPSIVNMQPNGVNNIRLVRLNNSSVQSEQAYRIIIDELPKPIDSRKISNGLQVLVRSSLPLFIVNSKNISDLQAQLVSQDNKSFVQIENTGSRHILLQELSVVDKSTNQKYKININTVNGYLLSGTSKQFEILDPTASTQVLNNKTNVRIELKSNGKDLSF
ncbi:fimbria/pilus periplasmic chaperone [Acinetobacter gerneri]|uniref:fimbrial biogenesis chaperone n=1 Tax=Acinetobacter gerneri TaxID=202952 RepID=UPI002935FE0E|nr:fimbria/pilus periplasmic chaperone [Acinetobacter gerneri]MDV2440157.1 fimbria/pilus periplasmic chaperone [Acinetobacter gerneri]